MDKRTIIALVLIVIVFIISNRFFWKSPQKQEQAKVENIQEEKPTGVTKVTEKVHEEESIPSTASMVNSKLSISEGEELNNDIVLENEYVRIFFTNQGGNIRQVQLKKIDVSNTIKNPVDLLLSNKGLLNIELRTGSENINTRNYILSHTVDRNNLSFYLEKDGEHIIEKNFILKEKYTLTMNLIVKNISLINSYDIGLNTGVFFDKNGDKHFKDYINSISQINNKIEKVKLKSVLKQEEELFGKIDWTSVKSKYFMIAVIPDRRIDMNQLLISAENLSIQEQARVEVDRNSLDHNFDLYLGPVIYDNLHAFNIGLENSMNFGWKVIRPISKLILRLLEFLHSIIPNYGFAIIILALIIKLIFYPLTHKGTRSTQKMQKIQPLVKATQAKYKGDPRKAQKEVMKLYKEHGVSPLGGCLPLLIQMPVLFALYPVLRSAFALRHAKFIFWLQDLSIPDPYYILPIIMGIAMFVQQKLVASKPTPEMDEKQRAQLKTQKFMMYGMPIFLVFIFKSFPAGLVLYWLSYNIYSIVEQLVIRKKYL